MNAIAQPTHAAYFPPLVKNILVIVNMFQDPRATSAVLAAMHARAAMRIHLLAIETPPSGYARFFLSAIDLRKVQHNDALKALAPLRAELDAAGIPYKFHVEFGRWLDTIARVAQEIGCAQVVVGDNPQHALRNLVLWHDCWRIRSFLRQSGRDCPVVQHEEAALEPQSRLPRQVSSRY